MVEVGDAIRCALVLVVARIVVVSDSGRRRRLPSLVGGRRRNQNLRLWTHVAHRESRSCNHPYCGFRYRMNRLPPSPSSF